MDDEPVGILIVDDNLANLVALESVLENLNQELVLARSGTEALHKLATRDFALVLMDIHMPGLDGYETVEEIRRQPELRHLPVMFLTAMYRDRESAARGYALGAVDFIHKPFEPDVIRAKVSAFVALHQYNERLKREQRAVADRDANRMKEEFIAVLGHDLRPPVDEILQTTTRTAHMNLGDPVRDANREIRDLANRMGRVIDDVVDFTRSRMGGIPIDPEAADMAELCRAPLDEIQTIHPGSRVSLRVEGNVRGVWDVERVLQVVAYLIGNAVRHGDGIARVTVRDAGEWVVLEVYNGGPAIPEAKMSVLFEPFDPGGTRREGLGLGLYIVDQLVRAHGGSIRAESSDVLGTTFIVRWPRTARALAFE